MIACHWRQPIEGWPHSGDYVHDELSVKLPLARLSHYQDEDMVLDVWSSDAASVHRRGKLFKPFLLNNTIPDKTHTEQASTGFL